MSALHLNGQAGLIGPNARMRVMEHKCKAALVAVGLIPVAMFPAMDAVVTLRNATNGTGTQFMLKAMNRSVPNGVAFGCAPAPLM